ncbi:polypeptide N-acetylgalactosaminyltransferase 1 [Nasonia vitripennis]|uniref:Polypeptide N-acetylgalactosaminyltransferase n=1 Tax=Nasonia vitripennis TaxID=7425 RepID=A0A7M7GHI4_NASVI|nr:polypeptide N-acetylgalactosaminyltransferase 1 [Nasonia vitripennis]
MRLSRRRFIYIFAIIILIIIAVKLLYQKKYGGATSTTATNFLLNQRFETWIETYLSNESANLGDFGEAAYLSDSEKQNGSLVYSKRAVNVVLSNKIPLQRRIRDMRDPLCKSVTYDTKLPTTSVVIIFHNEAWSVLLRTVYSVLQESPPKFLKEIILVDDNSNEEELEDILAYYIETRLPKKVKLLRLPKRQGLIRARLAGAQQATGDVLVFLDAHCEVTKGWLSPLLHRIKARPNAVLIPVIDVIDAKTLEYKLAARGSHMPIGGFKWTGDFTWINMEDSPKRTTASPIDPINTPTMAGGLFAIDRKYFWVIGSYDELMDGWGGENLEMSFRIWQCGGSIEIVPCSRVGHIFRDFFPYEFPSSRDTYLINTARAAHVWMDDYKRLFFLHHKNMEGNTKEIGDLTARKKLRERLQCASFKWYLQNVYPEKFIPDENVLAYGRARSPRRNLCLDSITSNDEHPFFLAVNICQDDLTPEQYFSVDEFGQLRKENVCATIVKDSFMVQMVSCNKHVEPKKWRLTKYGQIMHVQSGLCLDASGLKSSQKILARTCSKNTPDQQWKFDHYV